MPSDGDRLLIQQIRAGDSRAWENLVSRYEGRLRAFVQRRLHDHSVTDDIVQETFIGFLHSLPNYDEKRELQTYLFTIAAHKVTDHLRRVGRHPQTPLSEAGAEVLDQQFDRNLSVSSQFRQDERRLLETAALTRFLGQVLRTWREKGEFGRIQVMELLWVKGLCNRDVAAQLGISEQQVANIRFATVKKLTEQIRHAGLSPDVFPELQIENA